MCGIVGGLSFEGSSFLIDERYLVRMRDAMAHRGPDGAGLWLSADRHVGLGHRRLSIIDLSDAANQPMCNEDGSLHLVFNGEIYNHAEVRAELDQVGHHRWKTDHSDTEVILHSFEQWGIDCLEKLRGMFAFALWDERNGQLWLVRDRIGIKPLYYSIHHGRITFASEIKALLQDPEQVRKVNEEGLFHYLSFLTTPAPQTLFAGIAKLPPATWLRIDAQGHVCSSRYWDVWDHAQPLAEESEQDVADHLLDELRQSVRLRKVSDVPVGVFLSGGIDSSTNAALFSEGEQSPVKTFTIGYQGDYASYQNEYQYARQMAARVGAEHHELHLNLQHMLDFLPRMIHLQDEPIGDPVCVPVYYVSKLARENGVTVCQVGEGADELFWGYPTWKIKLRLQQLHNAAPLPRWSKAALLRGLGGCGKSTTHSYEALRRAVLGQPVFWGGVDAFPRERKLRLLSPRLRQRFRNYSSWEALQPIYERFQHGAWEPSPLNWMSYVDLSLRLPELLLMRVDKMSMGVSLEGRVPFLDHRFVERAMSIPQSLKTRRGILKYILKKSVRGLIPDELIDRKKQGFGVPVHEWILGGLKDMVRRELLEFCQRADFFDASEIERLLSSPHRAPIWYLLNVALWWKQCVAQEDVSDRMAA